METTTSTPHAEAPVLCDREDGLAIVGHGAASLAAEARLLAMPVTLEQPTSSIAEGIEDRVTMAPVAAVRLRAMSGLIARLARVGSVVPSAGRTDLQPLRGGIETAARFAGIPVGIAELRARLGGEELAARLRREVGEPQNLRRLRHGNLPRHPGLLLSREHQGAAGTGLRLVRHRDMHARHSALDVRRGRRVRRALRCHRRRQHRR